MLDHRTKPKIFQRGFQIVIWIGGLLAVAACAPRQPSLAFSAGLLLDDIRFESTLDWEAYQDPSIGVTGAVVDNVYRMEVQDGGFIWALGSRISSDVIVEVETEQLSEYEDNAYGVMCRADPSANGNGYYFFISGNGYYSIRRGVGREVGDLIPFSYSDAIRQGRDYNRIRVVCLDDYLALFVNGVFLAEVHDDRYGAGIVGLTAAVPDDGDLLVTFDDLLVFTAQAG